MLPGGPLSGLLPLRLLFRAVGASLSLETLEGPVWGGCSSFLCAGEVLEWPFMPLVIHPSNSLSKLKQTRLSLQLSISEAVDHHSSAVR